MSQQTQDDGTLRQFATGATRDTSEGKPEYVGFTSAVVTERFGRYMLKHQIQSDGSKRDAANWKKGIPQEAYLESLARHFEDVKLHLAEGRPDRAREPLEDALCAMLFNVQGLLHELLKGEDWSVEEEEAGLKYTLSRYKRDYAKGIQDALHGRRSVQHREVERPVVTLEDTLADEA